ncbi:MAG: hypothetical protein HYU27_06475 [Acidobacteria bacterium]|nr:hypothetical protein [Acidobacteriota bacterium]
MSMQVSKRSSLRRIAAKLDRQQFFASVSQKDENPTCRHAGLSTDPGAPAPNVGLDLGDLGNRPRI